MSWVEWIWLSVSTVIDSESIRKIEGKMWEKRFPVAVPNHIL